MTNEDIAIKLKAEGYNCAQAVIGASKDKLGANKEVVISCANGFGSGMGKQQKCCGALTGAYMVIGNYVENSSLNIVNKKESASQLIKDLSNKFEAEFGHKDCRDLLGCDNSTEEGKEKIRKEELGKKVCLECIKFSVRYIDNL